MRVLLAAGLVITVLAVLLPRLPVRPPKAEQGRLRWLASQCWMLLVLTRDPALLPGPVRQFVGWSWGSWVRRGPNCMAWALDRPTGPCDPGDVARIDRSDVRVDAPAQTPDEALALLELDSLRPLTRRDLRYVPSGYVVAVYATGEHYHFLRRDSDGRWSDKPGPLSANSVPDGWR